MVHIKLGPERQERSMTAGEPHPQRCSKSCDSCNFAEETNSKEYPVKCTISKPVPMMVHEYCIRWFEYVGCASHSSAGPVPNCNPPQEGKFCDYQDNCARTSSATCEYCDEAYSNKWKQHDAEVARAERERVLHCDDVTCYSTVLFELQELLQYINPESPAGKIIARRYDELWKARESLRSGEGVQQR